MPTFSFGSIECRHESPQKGEVNASSAVDSYASPTYLARFKTEACCKAIL
jgi:hypothetical protein